MRPFRPRFALVLSVVLLGVAAYYVASANAAPPKGTLTKCTGQTESSVPEETSDCTDDPFLCPVLVGEEGEECNGDQIIYSGVDRRKKPCMDGPAVANWILSYELCATTTICVLEIVDGNPVCTPTGGVSTAEVGECRKLIDSCEP